MEHIIIKDPNEALKDFLDVEGFIREMVKLIQGNEAWKATIDQVNEAGGWLRINVTIGQGEYGEGLDTAISVTVKDTVPAGQIDHVKKTLAGQVVKLPQLHEHAGKTEDDFPPTPASYPTQPNKPLKEDEMTGLERVALIHLSIHGPVNNTAMFGYHVSPVGGTKDGPLLLERLKAFGYAEHVGGSYHYRGWSATKEGRRKAKAIAFDLPPEGNEEPHGKPPKLPSDPT